MIAETPPVFRFAPSPNGSLHLGHAYSALLNFQMAREAGGTFLLRIEDIDVTRCRPDLETQMLFDLEWLGIEWDGAPRRQSEHFEEYREALETLEDAGLIYPSFMSRSQIKKAVAEMDGDWPRDPDNAPLFPGDEKTWSRERQEAAARLKPSHTKRLNMQEAIAHCGGPLTWDEHGSGPEGESGDVIAKTDAWGDVVLARSDTPTSYHLSVVVDDALQGITHVVRGRDLFHATSVHRVLQHLLGLPAPLYHHHDLILDETGRKLSKSLQDTSLTALRESGLQPADIRRMVGLDAPQ